MRTMQWALGSSVLLVLACSGVELDEPVGSEGLALTAPTQVGGFALLASGRVTQKDRSSVVGGHVGAAVGSGDAVTTGIDSKLGVGFSTLGQRIVLKDRAQAGDLFATTVSMGSGATRASLSPFAAPPAQPAITSFSAGSGSLSVNAPTTLSAGNYGSVTVNSTLTLSGGTYQLQSLTLGPNAIVQASAATLLRVAGKITGSNNVRLVPTGAQTAAALRIVVNGATDATGGIALGTDARLTALVLSRAAVTAADRFTGTGAIAARDINIANDGRFTFAVGLECNANSGCDDGNPCTADTCSDAKCAHATVANGTSCPSDGNDCTVDSCTAGACGHAASPSGTTCATGTCDGAGVCVAPECTTDVDCDDDVACTSESCVAGHCVRGSAPVGTACAHGNICDGAGLCVQCVDATRCDDDLSCTSDSCVDNLCTHGSAPAGTACGHTGSFCDGAGTCVPPECTTDAGCDDEDPCSADTCVSFHCTHEPAPVGTTCAHGNICDGAGSCVQCVDATRCDDDLSCTSDSCVDNLCAHGPAEAGTPCGHTGSFCDGAGVCLPPG